MKPLYRQGIPTADDYFGQLDIILETVALEQLDVQRVRAVDVQDQSGFVILMEDILDYYDDKIGYTQYRKLWQSIEAQDAAASYPGPVPVEPVEQEDQPEDSETPISLLPILIK